MPFPTQPAAGQFTAPNSRTFNRGMTIQQAAQMKGIPVPPRTQQFAPPMGQAPMPNPQAMPPMLQPAGQSPLAPQQPMGQIPTTAALPANIGQIAQQGMQAQQTMQPYQQAGGYATPMTPAQLQASNMQSGFNSIGGVTGWGGQPPAQPVPTTGTTVSPNGNVYNTNQAANAMMAQMAAQARMPQPAGQMLQQGLATLGQKYAEGGAVQMPDPMAWRPPMSGQPQMPQGMPQGMPPMQSQGMTPPPQGMMPPQGMAPPQGMMPPQGMAPPAMGAAPRAFANGGPVSAQDALGGTQIAKRYAKGGETRHDDANTPADDQMMKLMRSNPQFTQIIDQGHEELGDMPIEALNEFIRMIRMALRHPEQYQQIRMAAIKDKMVDPEDMPEQFDAQLLASILTTLVAMKKKQEGKTTKMATGGLAKAAQTLQDKGRNGDTILAHINPQEAAMLRAQGGTGTINPATGLVEYGFFSKLWKGIVKVAKIVAPIALTFLAPGVGTWIGSTFLGGLGATAAGVVGGALGGALTGAAGAAITGGNIGQGALLGGALGGMNYAKVAKGIQASRDAAGAAAASGAAAGGQTANQIAAAREASVQGVLDPATGQRLMPNIAPAPGSVAPSMIPGDTSALSATPGYTARAAEAGANAATAATAATSAATPAATAVTQAASATPSFTNTLVTGAKDLGKEVLKTGALMAATGALGGGAEPPPDIKQGIESLSPSQQEYFNRPSIQWDYDRIRADAGSAGMSISDFMNQNWSAISGGAYNKAQSNYASDQAKTQNAARGGRSRASSGVLSKVAYLAQGSGSGRADTIDAKLSDGEYVIDAETVALLGDGSTKEGARRLDMMRQQLRQQKGKQLARGQFSQSAKMPLAYIKGAR